MIARSSRVLSAPAPKKLSRPHSIEVNSLNPFSFGALRRMGFPVFVSQSIQKNNS
jgi:hypothetical protein